MMRGAPGIAGRAFSALVGRGVNIITIPQGPSEYNVSFVVEADVMRDAVLAVHKEFGLQRRASRFESLKARSPGHECFERKSEGFVAEMHGARLRRELRARRAALRLPALWRAAGR